MKVLILLCFLLTPFLSQAQAPNADRVLDRLNSGEVTDQTIWGAISYTYSLSDEKQKQFLDRIENQSIRELIGKGTEREAAFSSAHKFNSEALLYYGLLLEERSETRTEQFDRFYSSQILSEGLGLKLNKLAKNGEPLNHEQLDLREWAFQYFLTIFYTRNNDLSGDDFLSELLSVWQNRYENLDSTIDREFIVLSLTLSADLTDNFRVISRLYDDLTSIGYIPETYLLRDLYWVVDFAHYQLGQIDRSLYIQRNFSIPISEHLGDMSGVLSIRVSQAGYLTQISNYQESRSIYRDIVEIDGLPPSVMASLYNNLSLIYFKTGESSRYVDTQMNALAIAKETENYDQQLRIYRNLHIFYRMNRNWDLAEQYINEAAELALQTEQVTDLVSIYISKAVFEDQFLRNRAAAHRHLDRAEELLSDRDDKRLQMRILTERAFLYYRDQNFDKSEFMHQKVAELSAGSSDPSTYLEALVELANIYSRTNRYAEAADQLIKFRAHDISVLDFAPLVKARTVEAEIQASQGNDRRALEIYNEISDLVFERAANTSEIETGYWTVEAEYIRLIRSYADFLIEQGEYRTTLSLLDRFKTINDAALTDNPLVQATALSDEELNEIRNITEEMDQMRRQIFSAKGRDRTALRNQVERLSAQRAAIVGNSDEKGYQEMNIRSIQRQLRSGEQVIHITEIDSIYYMAKIDRRSIELSKHSVRSDDSELFESAILSLVTGNTDLESLYRAGRIFGFDQLGQTNESIIFIPDGYFYQLPLAVFPTTPPDTPWSYGSAQYLVEESDIRTVNSLRDLTERPASRDFDVDFIGFGVSDFSSGTEERNLISLPRAPYEIVSISERLNRLQTRMPFINEEATTARFLEGAGSSRILHLATHSEVSDSDPLFSRLHFHAGYEADSPEEKIRGQLFAYELFDLNLRNELVMLNSCESGGDRFLQGSGIMGISRALRYAGAQSLVLNAWSVNDQFAADFATLFYTHLNNGLSKSKAMQRAKVEFIQGRNADPHFWGAYVLNGDNRPLVPEQQSGNSGYILAALLILGITFSRAAGKKMA